MKLSVSPRTKEKKSDPKRNRRSGEIPAVLYGSKQPNRNIAVKKDEFSAILRNIRQGLLPTTIFQLEEGDRKYKALIKDIQYHRTSYAVEHIDFFLLSDNEEVSVNVPIQIVGLADCVGVKLGGFLRQVIRSMTVRCLPKDIPQEFSVDVREMNIAQSKTLGDIPLPDRVRPLAKLTEVALVIAKKV